MKKYLILIALFITTLSLPFLINNHKTKTTNNSEPMRFISPYDEMEFSDGDRINGYQVATTLVITKNIDIHKAIQQLKPYMCYYNGNPHNEGFRIDYEVKDNYRIVWNITDPNGYTVNQNTRYYVVDSPYGEYAYATTYSIERGTLLVKYGTIKSNVTPYEMFVEAFKTRYRAIVLPDFKLDIDLNYVGEVYDTDYFIAGNGNKYSCALRVVSTNNPIEIGDDTVLDIKLPYDDNNMSDLDSFLWELKNNNALKIPVIIFSTILGGVILLFILKIFRKTWRLLRS